MGVEVAMDHNHKLTHPLTLVAGVEYLLNERLDGDPNLALVPIIFSAYCSNPAFVIVKNGEGRLRCPRDDVFVSLIGEAQSL